MKKQLTVLLTIVLVGILGLLSLPIGGVEVTTSGGHLSVSTNVALAVNTLPTGTPAIRSYSPDWLSGYGYRKSFNITNTTAGAQTNYQMKLLVSKNSGSDGSGTVNLSGHCQDDFDDIRFTNAAGAELDYWTETVNSGANATVWVELDSVSATGNTQFYIYYGNSTVSSASNGNNTFLFFDDFSGDLSKWTKHIGPENITIVNGYLAITGGTTSSPYGFSVIGSDATYSNFTDGVIEAKYSAATDALPEFIYRGVNASNTGYKARYDCRSGSEQPWMKPPYSGWAGFGTSITRCGIDDGTWNIIKVIVRGTSFEMFQNDVSKANVTDATYAGPGEVGVANHYGSWIHVDDFRVRKYVSPEPAWGTWGSEKKAPPTVGTISISPSSMTPQEEWTNITISVTDYNTLADVNKVNVTVFYDAAGNDPSAPGTADVQTCAILTWTRGGSPVWSLDPTNTTWAINTGGCSNASDSLTTGNWVFSFKVGKVATYSPGSDDWDIYAKATDSISQTGDNYLRDVEMNWYGEIAVETSNISWGTVTPGCSNETSPVVNITYICNGNYAEQIKTSQNWTSTSGNVTLNTTGSPGTGEFSLLADDDDTIADAVQVLSASYTTFDTGTQTTEAGNVESNNHLWLSLGLDIPIDTYSGTIYFGIA